FRKGGSAWTHASLRTALDVGDGVRTMADGRVSLRSVSGQSLRLAPLSRILVVETAADQPTRVKMEGGSVWVSVLPTSPPRENIEVVTGLVGVTVRDGGVAITVGRDGSTSIRVYHGRAECSGRTVEKACTRALAGGDELLVLAGGESPQIQKINRDKPNDWVKFNEDQDWAGGYGTKPVEPAK
ncbi:MAG TPA: FecR domain-containing protein, partial [Candidatus Methylomirabilis sp.]|nr:FecR domain-containing protein [Candidatus Methylomirabilis sp.]